MAKKKKSNKVVKRKTNQKLMALTFGELMAKGDGFAASGKPRDAIKLYKMAMKTSKSVEQSKTVEHNLFSAYLARAKELTEKNMVVEAKALEKQALAYMPSPKLMDQSSMIALIGMSETREVLDCVLKYVKHKGGDPIVSAMIADKLITENSWHLLEKRADPLMLSRDAPIVKECLPLMDQGKWQQAADLMKGLPRTSPFAHIRMFCRAMVAFATGDDKQMLKAISFIPRESVFRKITDAIETSIQCVEQNTLIHGDKRLLACLWDGPIDIREITDQIIARVDKKRFDKKMKQLISTFANHILPNDPGYAAQYILETLWQQNISDAKKFSKFERSSLPQKAKLLQAKRYIVFPMNPLVNAMEYLNLLKKTGADADYLALTESIIILHLCNYIQSGGENDFLDHVPDKVAKRFGISPNEPFALKLMQFVSHGIQCDPGNRLFYELLIKLDSHSRDLKNLKEKLLLSMCEVYPDDPWPCIELASLYHSKNAFRKAENILKKAMEIAPYDSRVQDQHLISLIISADKGVNKNNFHLVWKDLEKAQKIDTGNNVLLLREKGLFYKICEKPEIPQKIIAMSLDGLSGTDRLKIVSMLRMDVEDKPKQNRSKILRKIKSLFTNEIKNASTLSSEEILRLLVPFPREWQYVFKSLNVHELFFQEMITILEYLDDNDFIKLADLVLAPDNLSFFQEEFEERSMEDEAEGSLILFYSLVLDGLVDANWDLEAFAEVLEAADAETKRKIQDVGNKLSRYTHGPYKQALQTLNFEILEDMFMESFWDDDDDHYYDDYDGDDFEPLDLFGGGDEGGEGLPDFNDPDNSMVKAMILETTKNLKAEDPGTFKKMFEEIRKMLEFFVDENGFRGAPKPLLKKIKSSIQEEFEIQESIAMLNLVFLKEAKKQLSREAQVLFLD